MVNCRTGARRSSARAAALAGAVLVLAVSGTADAQRPTEGGLFSYDETDVVESWDEPTGRVRVHYSVEGNNVTLLADDDTDGIPDFAQDVANTAAAVLAFYEDDLGLRAPVSEEEMGLGELGGSYALDVYLVDFAGNGDGAFGIDTCDSDPFHCSGFLSIENDFYGYGYPSLQLAIDVLTSHELFHGVQQAYDSRQDSWFTEGTATWAERAYDPDSDDFLRFADAYLADTARSINRPPIGPVPSFAYGTCLWWDFLTTRFGADFMNDLLVAVESSAGTDDATLAVVEDLMVAAGDTLEDTWLDFAAWNLASGPRAGGIESYDYAADLDGVKPESFGNGLDDENRFYPLATTYYRLDHRGGPIWFGIDEAAPDLVFALHPVQGGTGDGVIDEAAAIWHGDQAGAWALADGQEFPAGGYWLYGVLPARADQSVRVRICVGAKDVATQCGPEVIDDPDDPGDPGDPGGGCSTAPRGTGLPWLLMAAVLLVTCTRRRKA